MTTGTTVGVASRSDIYDVLRNVRRRYVIYYLKWKGRRVDVEELVDQIAVWESPPSDQDVSTSRRRSVHNALMQTHLPKLERHGLLEFDRSSRTVQPTERVETIDLYPHQQTVDWPRYFVALSGITILLATLDVFQVLPPVATDVLPWKWMTILAFVLLAVSFVWDRLRSRRRFREDGPDIVIDQKGRS